MTNQLERAAALLYPAQGRRAIDVKFFGQPESSVEALAEQVITCLAAMDDPSSVITNVDQGLTV